MAKLGRFVVVDVKENGGDGGVKERWSSSTSLGKKPFDGGLCCCWCVELI